MGTHRTNHFGPPPPKPSLPPNPPPRPLPGFLLARRVEQAPEPALTRRLLSILAETFGQPLAALQARGRSGGGKRAGGGGGGLVFWFLGIWLWLKKMYQHGSHILEDVIEGWGTRRKHRVAFWCACWIVGLAGSVGLTGSVLLVGGQVGLCVSLPDRLVSHLGSWSVGQSGEPWPVNAAEGCDSNRQFRQTVKIVEDSSAWNGQKEYEIQREGQASTDREEVSCQTYAPA